MPSYAENNDTIFTLARTVMPAEERVRHIARVARQFFSAYQRQYGSVITVISLRVVLTEDVYIRRIR